MEGYSTQDALHGATQGPTQDANQYPADERPVAEGNTPVEPGSPKDPGDTGREAQLENAETSLDEPSDGSGGE